MKGTRKQKGFTLIEILVVIGIIAILAAVVIVALNPGRQFAQARNTQRWSNINTILNAVGQRLADGRGSWRAGTPAACPALPATDTTVVIGTGGFDLASCIVPTYVSTMVVDPQDNADLASTGYTFVRNSDGRITISAPYAELDEVINVVR